jgi:hypothetical protein
MRTQGSMVIGEHSEFENICMMHQQCFIKQGRDEQLFWANMLVKIIVNF